MNYNDHATLTKTSLDAGSAEPSAPPAPGFAHPPTYEEAVVQQSHYPPQPAQAQPPPPGCYYPPVVVSPPPVSYVQQVPYPQQPPTAYYGSNATGSADPALAGVAVPQTRTLPVGPKPLKAVCPWCSRQIVTRVDYKNKYAPHICCFVLLASVVCACCSCLPYLMCPKERDEHFCPSCGASLGVYIHRS